MRRSPCGSAKRSACYPLSLDHIGFGCTDQTSGIGRRSQNILGGVLLGLWSWLKTEKESIESTTAILQLVAIMVGVQFAIREFHDDDRNEERERVDRTFELHRRSGGVRAALDTALELVKRYPEIVSTKVDSQKDARIAMERLREQSELFFTEVIVCTDRGYCKRGLSKRLFCSFAIRAGYLRKVEHAPRLSSSTQSPFHFAGKCYPDYYWVESVIPAWLPLWYEITDSSRQNGRVEEPLALSTKTAFASALPPFRITGGAYPSLRS